jgi:hypothetical protein
MNSHLDVPQIALKSAFVIECPIAWIIDISGRMLYARRSTGDRRTCTSDHGHLVANKTTAPDAIWFVTRIARVRANVSAVGAIEDVI